MECSHPLLPVSRLMKFMHPIHFVLKLLTSLHFFQVMGINSAQDMSVSSVLRKPWDGKRDFFFPLSVV